MSQCVPSWDLDDNSDPRRVASSNSSIPSMEYQVAELTWENGQLAMHGLAKVPQRVGNKPVNTTWDKPRAGGTLESIVNQATRHPKNDGDNINVLVPWFDHHRKMGNSSGVNASMTMTMDALVPCNNNKKDNQEHVRESSLGLGTCVVGCSTRVGSCSGARVARVGMSGCKTTNVSLSEGSTCGGTDSRQLTLDTCGGGFTSPSLGSPENSSGKEYTKISGDDHDSVCHSRLQKKGGGEDGKKKGLGVSSSVSTKRSRAAAIHNQSERKRRDKINQRMKTLQKLVPNSSKTDKASMLDEVIEYLKQLQAQVHMISRMNMPSMMFPLAMQQQLQMSMMGMGVGMGMGMGVMDMNNISRAAAGMPPVIPPAAFMPLATSWDNLGDRLPNSTSVMTDPFSSFLACQSQPMSMDVYNRLAAMQQQFQQNNGSGPKN